MLFDRDSLILNSAGAQWSMANDLKPSKVETLRESPTTTKRSTTFNFYSIK